MKLILKWLTGLYRQYRARKASARLERRISKIRCKQDQVYNYLKKEYLKPYLFYVNPNSVSLGEREKIVWQYWDSGEESAPLIVQSCIHSVRQNLPFGYRHIVLNDKNINDYVQIPDWVIEKRKNNPSFRIPFFSDILRLCLLEKYGGVWIDATIFLSDQIPGNILKSSFFVFYRGKEPPDHEIYEKFDPSYFSWQEAFKVKLCNSFIISDKSHPFISALKSILLRYWREENEFQHYFVFQMLFDQLIKCIRIHLFRGLQLMIWIFIECSLR